MTIFRCKALPLAAAFALAACGGDQPAAPPSPTPTPAASVTPEPSPADQLAAAVAIAFPKDKVVQSEVGERYVFDTHRLIDTPFGPVLASEGRVPDAAHVTSGRIDLAYLKRQGRGFAIARDYPAVIEVGSFGQMTRWDVRNDLADVPVIAAYGGFTGQGITCGNTVLTELRPSGPVEAAIVPTVYDNGGMAEGKDMQSLEGTIVNPSRKGFDVRYTGTRSVTVHYARQGDHFVRLGADPVPEC
ncbi:hypothetical protein [uncultured Sphingomonas sp.]|uniref:hypothetical protein n=1 Tax=uncultured Sphingomonas sp. TaxID=158754 RepID=UPI0025F639A1|nr:hypothetical protein [uncultured Sphingomonas sp.]